MYQFAVVALLALAVVKLVDFVDGSVPVLSGYRSIFTFVFGLGAIYALDFSIFEAYGIDVRSRDMGMWLTGFIVAGFTVPWRAAFGWMTHDRAAADETLGEPRRMRAA